MKRQIILALIVAASTLTATSQNRTQVIAHRGNWTAEGSAQNSRHSLSGALALGIYGSEIDIWLTTDGKLMVNHDDAFNGVTIKKATSKQCKALTLKNGEHMPQLKDMLKILKKSPTATKLIIEVKPHGDKVLDQKAAQEAMKQVRKRHLENRVDYISFSLDACKELVRLDPSANVAYLSGDIAPKDLHAMGINGIDYHISPIRKHPEWISEAHALGMTVNVWTVDKSEDMEEMKSAGVDFITTNQPAKCEEICKK